jgi:hypothetical protein
MRIILRIAEPIAWVASIGAKRSLVIYRPPTMLVIYLAEQFPDPANFFPVLRKVFPVSLLRELREKSLQRSGF